jgi:hypothetical protein
LDKTSNPFLQLPKNVLSSSTRDLIFHICFGWCCRCEYAISSLKDSHFLHFLVSGSYMIYGILGDFLRAGQYYGILIFLNIDSFFRLIRDHQFSSPNFTITKSCLHQWCLPSKLFPVLPRFRKDIFEIFIRTIKTKIYQYRNLQL